MTLTTMPLLAQVRLPGTPQEWLTWGLVFFAVVLALAFVLSLTMRRVLGGKKEKLDDLAVPLPRSTDPAYAAASMQAVIARLREQEKELERLHRLERERAQQTERLSEAVTRDMPTGLLVINAAGLVTMANPAARQTLGLDSLSFRRYSEVFGETSELTTLLRRCLGEAATFQREELDHATPAGRVLRLGVTISPVLQTAGDPARKAAGAVCLLTDLTEISDLQRQMRMKENLATLGEMSAGIAHEFKNALATISGYAQMLRSDAASSDQRENAAKIVEQTRNLTHVVTEFLRFARPFDVSLDAVELAPLLHKTIEEVATALPAVRFTCDGEFRACAGDAGLLHQAFSNLLRNGAEAAAAAQPGDAQVHIAGDVASNSGRLQQRLLFRDNGPGIAPEDMPRIFLPFYTTKSQGSGLGLALVQKIVLQHGGTVEARNRPAGGAEFILWLPLAPGPNEAIESPPARI
jgi:signal transduction histidine kinase